MRTVSTLKRTPIAAKTMASRTTPPTRRSPHRTRPRDAHADDDDQRDDERPRVTPEQRRQTRRHRPGEPRPRVEPADTPPHTALRFAAASPLRRRHHRRRRRRRPGEVRQGRRSATRAPPAGDGAPSAPADRIRSPAAPRRGGRRRRAKAGAGRPRCRTTTNRRGRRPGPSFAGAERERLPVAGDVLAEVFPERVVGPRPLAHPLAAIGGGAPVFVDGTDRVAETAERDRDQIDAGSPQQFDAVEFLLRERRRRHRSARRRHGGSLPRRD